MKYKFKVKPIDLTTGGGSIVALNEYDAEDLNISLMDRVILSFNRKEKTALVDLTKGFVKKGEIGVFSEVAKKLKIKKGDTVFLEPIEKPPTVSMIKKKIDGIALSKEEIESIIKDVMNESLSDVELTAFITSIYIRGLSSDETVYLTKAIVNSGNVLTFKKRPIMGKHCIGGVPGNKTTMLIVPIVAAAGLTIPKTSSRAITSPAGTADTMEVLAPVALNMDQIVDVVSKSNGCIVWGGAVNLAAADDKLIKIRHPLRMDPRGVLLASILSKKKAEGATHVLVDLPIGKGAKLSTKHEADQLAREFMDLGLRLDMEVQCIITPGYDPIGMAVGPALEAKEILRILQGEKVSMDLIEKSLVMAGILLEIGEKAGPGKGRLMAQKILERGEAYKKMQEIIKLQGGNPKIKPKDIKIGSKKLDIIAKSNGRIHYMDVHDFSAIGRAAGAPKDKGAGIYFYVEKGDKIKKGQKIFTIYAESERKLDAAKELYEKLCPVELEKVILGKLSTETKPHVFDIK